MKQWRAARVGLFDEMIRLRREEFGLDQSTLAGKVGVGQQTISRWETGACLPKLAHLARLAEALDLDAGLLHRLAGRLPPGESSPASAVFSEILARMPELSDAELLLLLDRAWQVHWSRLGLHLPAGER